MLKRCIIWVACGLWFAVVACFDIAWANAKRPLSIPKHIYEAAMSGDAYAQHELGRIYRKGDGVEPDLDAALTWYMKAAKQGYAKSEYGVAYTLAFESKRDRDYEAALPWLIKAAGSHDMPQMPGYAKTQERANSRLMYLCKKGVVEFPQNHALSQNPKCWLGRGNRFYSGRDKLGEFLIKDQVSHGIETNYEAARYYLEKALDAGEKDAAVTLARMYKHGRGVEKDDAKYRHYLKIAGQTGHGETNYVLALEAQEQGDIDTYLDRLTQASTRGYKRAARRLGDAYFKGEISEKDLETAFMYYFISEKREYLRPRGRKGGLWPFEHEDMLNFFRSDAAESILGKAKVRADSYAEKYEFRDSRRDRINGSYNIAVSDILWVKETGGDWYKDSSWFLMFLFLFCGVGYMCFAFVFKRAIKTGT